MKTVLFRTFECYSRTVHFRHTETVVSLYTQQLLDTFPLFFRVRFGSDTYGMEFGVAAWINSHLVHHFRQTGSVTGNDMEASRTKVGNELDLPFGISAAAGTVKAPKRSAPYWNPNPPVNIP